MCEMAWVSKDMPAKIYRKWVVSYDKYHPTQKPDDLMVWCLSFFPEADLILDPFLGSGTTALAAKILNRKCIGIEIEEKYCEIAAKRCCQSVMRLEV
ncbi:MAG: site-specific DNA-methyltransferase [Dehalococcoidales bacterium]|nr:site-specific DNA-methyltransferase [Dehalococcoidales bacterium]